jgi:flagellar biosynthetic protein FliR
MYELTTIADQLMALLWAFMRASAMIMLAPLLGAMFVPARVRLLMAVVIALAMVPLAGAMPAFSPLSPQGLLAIVRELTFGAAIGFVLRLATESALLAGQLVSTGMGLTFATVVDPQQGGMPLLGRFYIIVASLVLLATNAHLSLMALLAQSYQLVPIGTIGIGVPEARAIVDFAALMFAGAVSLALPSVVAILMVNVAFGVISRAAPTLNLFAVGFPITILLGLLTLVYSIRTQAPVWDRQIGAAFSLIGRMMGGG